QQPDGCLQHRLVPGIPKPKVPRQQDRWATLYRLGSDQLPHPIGQDSERESAKGRVFALSRFRVLNQFGLPASVEVSGSGSQRSMRASKAQAIRPRRAPTQRPLKVRQALVTRGVWMWQKELTIDAWPMAPTSSRGSAQRDQRGVAAIASPTRSA